MIKFTNQDLKKLWRANGESRKGENGQVTIIGGSKLFHGAPIFVIRVASRMVDMVYFSSLDPDLEKITAKASLGAFIWVPWEEIDQYVAKSDAVLIGSGMMRYSSDGDGQLTRSATKYFLQKYPEKKWVIDGGNAGLTKGGTGDVQAGLTVGLLAKNEPLRAAASVAYLVKKTAEKLEKTVGLNFNADDLSKKVFEMLKTLS